LVVSVMHQSLSYTYDSYDDPTVTNEIPAGITQTVRSHSTIVAFDVLVQVAKLDRGPGTTATHTGIVGLQA